MPQGSNSQEHGWECVSLFSLLSLFSLCPLSFHSSLSSPVSPSFFAFCSSSSLCSLSRKTKAEQDYAAVCSQAFRFSWPAWHWALELHFGLPWLPWLFWLAWHAWLAWPLPALAALGLLAYLAPSHDKTTHRQSTFEKCSCRVTCRTKITTTCKRSPVDFNRQVNTSIYIYIYI